MSLLRTFDRTSAVAHAALLCPVLTHTTPQRSFTKRAAACHPSRLRDLRCSAVQRLDTRSKSSWQKKDNSDVESKPASRGSFAKIRNFAKKELKALVDYYGIDLDSQTKEKELPDFGQLMWNVGDMHEPWPLSHAHDAAHIKRLEKLLKDEEASHDDVFETYRELPSPGVVYLKIQTIRALLHHLSIVERPSPMAMQRFLSILDDMKTAHIHIVRSEWTSAVHLAGRAMGNISAEDVQSALNIWRDMEHRAGVKAGLVTLNVLFDIAVKAGKFSLAEAFVNELQVRKLSLHRHWRVSLLYYYGVLQNGNAVRKTYREIVASGEIVDTAVLNAVIAALIRAGEPLAAEHVFERMKRLHAEKASIRRGHVWFTRTWRQRRHLGLHFAYEARRLKKAGNHEELKELQDYAPVAPNARTYALLIRHQTSTTGDFDRADELLQEMRYNSVALEGTIFIVMFQGFHNFGGARYTAWTPNKLEKLWAQYFKALRNGVEHTWLSSMAIIAALKAFSKCTDAQRTLKVWDETRTIWDPNEEELESVMRALRKLIPTDNQELFNKGHSENGRIW